MRKNDNEINNEICICEKFVKNKLKQRISGSTITILHKCCEPLPKKYFDL